MNIYLPKQRVNGNLREDEVFLFFSCSWIVLGSDHCQATQQHYFLLSPNHGPKRAPQISFCLHPEFACKHIIFILFPEMLKTQKRLQNTIHILFYFITLDIQRNVLHYFEDIKEHQ